MMARTPTRTPPSTPQPVPEPAIQLPARPNTYRMNVFTLVGVGAVGAGFLGLWQHQTAAAAVAVGVVCLAIVLWWSGSRTASRDRIRDRLVEALASATGTVKLDRRAVRLMKWRGRGAGTPSRIVISFSAATPDNDTKWLEAILSVVARRLEQPFKVADHQPHALRRKLVLVPKLPSEEPPEPPYAQVRVTRAISQVVGVSTKIDQIVTDAEGEITRIEVSHEEAAKCAVAGFRLRFERTLIGLLGGQNRWRTKWDLVGDKIMIERRPPMPTSVWIPVDEIPEDQGDDLLRTYRQLRIPLGVDEDGHQVCWQPAIVPQMLVTGGTGSGKTSLLHTVVATMTRLGWPVWILDAKRIEFLGFRNWPNVQVVATTVEQQVALVHRVWALMEYRYQLIEEGRVRIADLEPLGVVLDEWAEFVLNLMDWYAEVKVKGDPTKPPTLREDGSIARKARTARIHTIKTLQRPDVALMGGNGGETRSNYGQRVSLGRLDPNGALMMWENAYTGVTIPRGVIGRAMAVNDAGVPVEIQCYRFPDINSAEGTEEYELLNKLRPSTTRHERLVIIPPEQELDLDTSDPIPVTYSDIQEAEWALASSRPDLDYALAGAMGNQLSPEEARQLASTLVALGLGPNSDSEARTRVVEGLLHSRTRDEDDDEDRDVDRVAPGDEDLYAGYGPPVHLRPLDVEVGSLIQVSDADDEWVVVDADPEEDPVDPDCVMLSWRSDYDACGSVSIPSEELVSVRRPDFE